MSDERLKDANGYVWYVHHGDVLELPDLFGSEVQAWLKTDMPPWQKDGRVDSGYYPLAAESLEQLQARLDMLENGVGSMPGVRTHGRRSLHI